MTKARPLSPHILRANDIRGTYGRDLTDADALALCPAFGTMIRAKGGRRVAVAYDGRLSSPPLEAAFVDGLVASGMEAVRIGLGPTPMLYFAVFHHHLDGGVMITGSHNPPDMNGFKMMIGREPFHGHLITELGEIAAAGRFASGEGWRTDMPEVLQQYVEALAEAYRGSRPLVAAWDPGNGATGEVVRLLCQRLPGRHVLLNAEIDGSFPNHHPDPTVPENLQQLIAAVKREGCELGLAFDGDGDRIGVVDARGRILWGDQMLALFAEDVLSERPGATIIADVKASDTLFQRVAELGGKPLMWKTGHSFIKSKMGETGALLAGEMSGHIFFADRYFGFDDGVYAAVRFLSLVSNWQESLAQRYDRMPQPANTPELRFACPDERKFGVIEEVRARLAATSAKVTSVDGLRVHGPDGWWLLRASNTQPVLVGRCEGADASALERLKEQLLGQLRLSSVKPELTH